MKIFGIKQVREAAILGFSKYMGETISFSLMPDSWANGSIIVISYL